MALPDELSRGFGRRRDVHRITIVHGDRVRAFQFDTGWITAGVVGLVVFAVAWAGATGWLMFRDDVLAGAANRQVRLERAYEDRVATLRSEIDRINGRQLIDQDTFEAKIDQLVERQRRLDEMQAHIGGLIGRVADVGLKLPPSAPVTGLAPLGGTSSPAPATSAPSTVAPAPPPKASIAPLAPPSTARPNGDTATPPPLDIEKFATPLRSSWFAPFVGPAHAGQRAAQDPARTIAAVERHIDLFEKQQRAGLETLADAAEKRDRAFTRVLGRLGWRIAEADSHPRPRPRPDVDGVGGPFVPVDPTQPLARADAALNRLGRWVQAAAGLPLARPMPGTPTVTSGFGTRIDPFMGAPAMHTGIDFRAETGAAVHVTAGGLVVGAGRQGGYGLCVDVDHGGGIVTRYGHLSGISVAPGQRVKTGDVVGSAGNTGRSTAPHLHYETRVGGEAVDPTRWLDAGRELGL